MSRKLQLSIVALFLAVVAGTGGWIYYQQHRFKHFAVHEPGMVYRSAWLAPDALVVIEEAAEAEIPAPPGLERLDLRTYGDTKLEFFARRTGEQATGGAQ